MSALTDIHPDTGVGFSANKDALSQPSVPATFGSDGFERLPDVNWPQIQGITVDGMAIMELTPDHQV